MNQTMLQAANRQSSQGEASWAERLDWHPSSRVVVEHGLVAQVFADPQHAYTQELLSSIPGKHWQPPATGLDRAEVAS